MSQSDRVGHFFDKTSGQFDAIYTNDNFLLRAFNRLVRRDVYDRFNITMRECTPAEGETVLDVGCGSGPYAVTLAQRGARVIGIDLSPRMIEMASGAVGAADQRERVKLAVADAANLAPNVQFTYVIAMGVFDYVADAATLVTHLARFAGQKLVISFPRRWFPRSEWRTFRYGLRNCPVYFYSLKDVRRLGQLANGRAVRVEVIPGPGYDFVMTVEF